MAETRRQAAERRQAEDELRRALETIAARGGPPQHQSIEAMQAILGRGWRPGRLGPAYCPNHTRTRMPCGLCPPGA